MNHKSFFKKMAIASIGIGMHAFPIHADAANLHTWVVDWDQSSYQEYNKRKYDSVSNFAISFKEDLSMAVPEKFNGKNVYLSFVNDLPGKPKSLELTKQLLKDDKSINTLIDKMIQHANGYYGVELDFENFWKDEDLTKQYMILTYRLYHQCLKHGLKLRIVLEPSFTAQDFAKGPEYVVMCYNLYGKHSIPGPKADYDFLDRLIEKSKSLPNVSFAIANGGCVWSASGGAKYVTYKEVQELHPENIIRDKSDVLIGTTCDKIIYYADNKTIKNWQKYLNKKGYDVSIWRLGGNI